MGKRGAKGELRQRVSARVFQLNTVQGWLAAMACSCCVWIFPFIPCIQTH
jgi:hypothetical protein